MPVFFLAKENSASVAKITDAPKFEHCLDHAGCTFLERKYQREGVFDKDVLAVQKLQMSGNLNYLPSLLCILNVLR